MYECFALSPLSNTPLSLRKHLERKKKLPVLNGDETEQLKCTATGSKSFNLSHNNENDREKGCVWRKGASIVSPTSLPLYGHGV